MIVPLINFNYLGLFDWVWSRSAKVSILIILLLLVKFVLQNKIGARTQYLLWSVVVVSLLIPWIPQSSLSLYNLTKLQIQSSSGFTPTGSRVAGEMTPGYPLEQVGIIQNNLEGFSNTNESPNSQASPLISIVTLPFIHKLLFLIWITGIAVLIASTIGVNRKFARRIQGQPVVDGKLISALRGAEQVVNMKGTIPLILTEVVQTPSLFGLFRPKLLLPVGILDEFSSEQLNHIFVHELVHLKRKDILLNWLIRGLLFLHWFNPILWYAFSKSQEDQEVACDELTLSYIGINQAQAYGSTLIKLVECYSQTHLASIACLSGSKSQIKRRLNMLKMLKQASVKWTVLGLMVVTLIAVAALTSVKADANTPMETTQTSSTTTAVTAIEASLTPFFLNQELVEQVKTQFGKERYFSYSTETDIASIAYGRMLTIMSNDKLQIGDALPTQPIFVKSYDKEVRDYFLVPFVSNNKYVATAIVMTYADGTAGDGGAIIYPLEKRTDKYFKLSANEAEEIVGKPENINDVPLPTLAYLPSIDTNRLELPYWKFVLNPDKTIYVNQSDGKILDTAAISNTDSSNESIKPSQVPGQDWSVAITRLVFKGGINQNNKLANVYLTISNNNGVDKAFLPAGRIVGYVGVSGKVYQENEPFTLGEEYQNDQELLKEKAQKFGTVYQPGLETWVREILIDGSEKGFNKVIYQDENGRKVEIPIQEVTPEIPAQAQGV